MSALLRSSLKLNFRQLKLSWNILPHVRRSLYLTTPSLTLTSRHASFAAIAHQYNTSYESEDKLETEFSQSGLISVDRSLSEIDFHVQRTGRTVRKDVENVLSLIEKVGFASETQSLYLLRCCVLLRSESPLERVALANDIWEKLQSMGCQFNIGHFNSLLKAYLESDHPFSPSEYLARMDNYKIKPNKLTYSYLLEKYCKDGDLDGASEILQFLKEKGLPINEGVFNLLIKGHMRANDIAGAKGIFEVMAASNLSPTADSYTVLACEYAAKNDVDGVKSVLVDAKNNVVMSSKNYLSIITSLSTEVHTGLIDELIEMLGDVHVWKQDILNSVIDLVHKNLFDIAFKLVLVVSGPEDNYGTNVFVKQLIKCEKPIEKIIHYCEEIYKSGLNDYIFLNSFKAATSFQKHDYGLSLMELMQKNGVPVRIHYFWPYLSYYRSMEEGIWLTLKKMCELGIPADFATYKEFVFPVISLANPENVVAKIKQTGQSLTGALDPLFQYYCCNGNVDNALFLTENYSVCMHSNFNLKNYLSLYKTLSRSNSYFKVLSFVIRNVPAEDVCGRNLALLIQTNPFLFENLHKTPYHEKHRYSRLSLDICWKILRNQNPMNLVYLERLVNAQSSDGKYRTFEEERKSNNFNMEGVSKQRYLLGLLSDSIREKNLTKISELEAELDNLGVVYQPISYVQLLVLYCESKNVKMAEKSFCTLKEKYPNFKIDLMKVIDYATLLVQCSRFEEAMEVIKNECQELKVFGGREAITRSIKKLFNAAIEFGDPDLVISLRDSLIHHSDYLQSTVIFHEPLLKLHLLRNDLERAVQDFEKCISNDRVAPCLNLLLKKCIVADDLRKLEVTIDAAAALRGRDAVLPELALAFIETRRSAQAKNVIQNLGNKADISILEGICSRLCNQKRVLELEEFVDIISNLEHINKDRVFYYLFKVYNERNDVKKAAALYDIVEKENLFIPSNATKHTLSGLLKRNNQPVHFSISEENLVVSENSTTPSSNETVKNFIDSINKEDVDESLELLRCMKKGFVQTLSFNDMARFIDLLVRKKLTHELYHNAQAMSYIIENGNLILKPLLEKYSETGNVDALHGLADFIPDFTLRKCLFNTFFSKAYVACGRHEDLMLELESRWDKKSKLFSFFAFEELLKVPPLSERVVNLAVKYLSVNFDLPIAVVWAQYLIGGDYDKAKELFKLHPIAADKVDTLILKAVQQKGSIVMGREYINAINEINARSRCKERAYGTVLEVLVSKEMYDEAATLMVEAKEKGINLELHYRQTLANLKSMLEMQKKDVPFTLSAGSFVIS